MTNPYLDAFGAKYWYQDGFLHREDGPALITETGVKHWIIVGKRHRVDGPAIEFEQDPSHNKWYINGKEIKSCQHYQKLTGLTDEEMTVLILKYGDIGV